MGDALARAGKARAQLHAGGAHFQIGGDRLAPADAAGHEHRNLLRHFGQDFLRQHAGRDRADMAARFHALDHQRVDARSHQLLRQRQRGRKADQLGAIGLDRLDAALGRQATGQHDMAHLMLGAHRDQVEQLRMHGDQVHAERLVGQRPGRRNFRVQQFGRHRATGNHTETAGVRDRRHQMPLTDPAHRPAQDRALAAEKFGAAGHQGSEFGSGHRRKNSKGNQPFALRLGGSIPFSSSRFRIIGSGNGPQPSSLAEQHIVHAMMP